jgi:NAD(P) transhydrogenase subunit alpha
MRPGAIVVDLAAASGGNVSASRPDEEVVVGGVRVLGPTDLASRGATDASALYARNVVNLVVHLAGDDGALVVDPDDEIAECVIAHGGEVRHPRLLDLLGRP